MRERILPIVTPEARELVARHLREADLVAIVTATNSFVTTPIAREFGVAHLIATEPERANGKFTGRVSGLPCFREGKVARLESWLAGRGLRWGDVKESWFYSDSMNDLALLEKVNHPFAVDPDDTLRVLAGLRGWPIISLR